MRFYSTDFGISKVDAVSGTVCCEAQAEYRHCSHLGVFKKGMRQIRLRKQPKAIKHMCRTIAKAWGIGLITYRIIKPTLMFFSTSSLLLYVHFTNISFPKTQEINIFDLLKAMLGLTFLSLSLSPQTWAVQSAAVYQWQGCNDVEDEVLWKELTITSFLGLSLAN